jgi:phage tail tape-measure protein
MSDNEKTAQEQEHDQIGRLSGTAAGVLAGASLGSAVMPVIGTFAGALAGGIMGSEIGRSVGGALLNAIDKAASNADAPKPVSENADLVSQLERLGQLRTQDLITAEEYNAAKAKLLGL